MWAVGLRLPRFPEFSADAARVPASPASRHRGTSGQSSMYAPLLRWKPRYREKVPEERKELGQTEEHSLRFAEEQWLPAKDVIQLPGTTPTP